MIEWATCSRETACLVLLCVAVGCGGEVDTLDNAGGESATTADGSSSSMGGGGGCSTPCPEAPAADGTACDVDAVCTYGAAPFCRTQARCAGGTWDVFAPDPDCAATDPECPERSPIDLTSCASEGSHCAYPDGTRCTCTSCSQGGPCGAPGPRWICGTPEAGCPTISPNAGTCCSAASQTCGYGTPCTFGAFMVCGPDGLWAVDESLGCPS